MGKRKRPKPRGPDYSPLSSQRKEGTKLKGPLAVLSPKFEAVDWLRDFLPEHLWIAALAERVGLENTAGVYNAFMDQMDAHWPHDFVAFGLISDFGLIPEAERTSFLEKNAQMIDECFHGPIGRIMSLYPESPAAWLVQPGVLQSQSVDPFVELGYLRRLVVKLAPGKDKFSARIRAIPVNRLFKHNKLFISKNLPVVDLIAKYPGGLTEDEQLRVESMARSTMNMSIQTRKVQDPLAWPKYFWQHNYDLLTCKPSERRLIGGEPVSASDGAELTKRLRKNAAAAREYLLRLRNELRIDLYDPTRAEVLFGLFARLTRLYVLMADDPFLWARDVSGIMLRPLAETAITFLYLAKRGTPAEFRQFIEYGEGQQKLLMLHLQDNYPNEKSLDGLSAEQLAEQIEVWPEVLEIELGSWSKKDARKLAQEAGVEDLYRLVFTPASSDLHGSWISLRSSNLTLCEEPLHRWHRIPTYAEPPFFVNTAIAAQELYERCRLEAEKSLGYPSASKLLDLSIDGAIKSPGHNGGEPEPAEPRSV